MQQTVFVTDTPAATVCELAEKRGVSRLLLVCDAAFPYLSMHGEYESLPLIAATFGGFSPNPKYEEVTAGLAIFRSAGCDGILAIGGGSALDTAKCIKAFSGMEEGAFYLGEPIRDVGVPLFAVPTTAGTGSESTHFAVVYYGGEKHSVAHPSLLPDYALLDARALHTLPLYQKKCTMLDALAQAIESCWSVNASDESRPLSLRAIRGIMGAMDAYLAGDAGAAREMMLAANLAGQAINLTQTTAAHAMSYKLTSLYGIPHGRAAFSCLPFVFEYMLQKVEKGSALAHVFAQIANALGCTAVQDAPALLKDIGKRLFSAEPATVSQEDVPRLAASVNPGRLKNNPIPLDGETLASLYTDILAFLCA